MRNEVAPRCDPSDFIRESPLIIPASDVLDYGVGKNPIERLVSKKHWATDGLDDAKLVRPFRVVIGGVTLSNL